MKQLAPRGKVLFPKLVQWLVRRHSHHTFLPLGIQNWCLVLQSLCFLFLYLYCWHCFRCLRFPPPFIHFHPVPSCRPSGRHHTVVCASGLCAYVFFTWAPWIPYLQTSTMWLPAPQAPTQPPVSFSRFQERTLVALGVILFETSCPWPFWLPSLSTMQVDSCVIRSNCFQVLEAHASFPRSSGKEQAPVPWGVLGWGARVTGPAVLRFNPGLAGCEPGSPGEVVVICFCSSPFWVSVYLSITWD